MFSNFHRRKTGKGVQEASSLSQVAGGTKTLPRRRRMLWISSAGVLLLLTLVVLTPGRAFAFHGTISWTGWSQVLRAEPPAAPAPMPTDSGPVAADFTVQTPITPCTLLCFTETNTRFLFVHESDNTVQFSTSSNALSRTSWSALTPVPGNGQVLGSPSAVQFGSTLYLFVRGTDSNLWVNTFNGTNWVNHWTQVLIGGNVVPLSASPDVVVYQNKLFVFTRHSDSTIHFLTTSNGSNWTDDGAVPFGGLTPSALTASVVESTLYLFAQGDDNNVWVNMLNGTTWGNGQGVFWHQAFSGGTTVIPTTTTPAVAIGDDGLELFVRLSDESVRKFVINSTDASQWSGTGEVPTGGRILNAPFALSGLSLFAEGLDGNVWEDDENFIFG